MERYCFFLNRLGETGDVMAESRGGKEDMRLKRSFPRIWEKGTDYVPPEDFQRVLTSREVKIRSRHNNVAGPQVADLIAHPVRNEILLEQKMLDRVLAPFVQKVVQVLQDEYDKRNKVYGKKFL